MCHFQRCFVVTVCTLAVAAPLFAASRVKVSQQQVTIPTYLIGAPDPNPQFYFGGTSQGAQHRIYPYPVYDNLTTEKVDKDYKMIYLENEYIKVGILPEIGGKIFEGIDKTNGYNFFYRQHVIKPALISLLGAWISGGVEWDVPHHHRATSFLPVQYTIEAGPDGSQTVWVGELELRDRMRWAVGITLHPGKSYLEASFRVINRTPLPASMLCFSNVAVSVNDSYQVIFPPSTQHVTYHGKRSFTTWPIATGRFNNTDFDNGGAGTDVSWVKAHVGSNSMFAWNFQDDFLAGYDHVRNAGTMSIADHNVVPGKKFFTWGTGPSGKAQNALLTDSDGPYIELMVGAYSDNQPDYSWLEPYETRSWTQYWYPFRDIDGVKNANTEAAVNLELKDGKARLGFYATAEHSAATFTLKLKDEVLLSEQISIGPGKAYVKEIAVPAAADPHDLRATLTADGKELIAYAPVKLQPEAMPAPVTNYPTPQETKTNEELYLNGLRVEQFRAPGATPDPYWQEALRREPGDVRVNTALGIDAIKAGCYAEAEKYLRHALQRATDRYTTPKDGEPFYYLGLALKAQGKTDDAFNQFAKSTWAAAWRGPGYFGMAEIASLRGDYLAALSYCNDSLKANAENVRALALKAALLRHTGHADEALTAVAAIRKIDPLDVHASIEYARFLAAMRSRTDVIDSIQARAFPATGLEVATDYINAGLWEDAASVLSDMRFAKTPGALPLVYYYLGYIAQKMNQPQKAAEYFQRAARAPGDFVFPFQMEMIPVLEAAMAANPKDARASYYLGNLLYDWQPERAVALWQKSAELGADFPVVYRNLALVNTRSPNAAELRPKTLAYLEKAVSLGGNAMVLNELDKLYEEDGVAPEKRLALLEQHQGVIDRDDVISREINLDIFAGKYDAALKLLKARFFRSWEGGSRFSLGDSWVNANLLKGRQQLAAGQHKEALASFQAAVEFPPTLQDAVGNAAARKSEVSCWIGNAYEALGEKDKAEQAWRDAATVTAAEPAGRGGAIGKRGGKGRGSIGGQGAGVRVAAADSYYQALALQKLGQADRATTIFQELVETGTQAINNAPAIDGKSAAAAQRARVADAHYLVGLGQLGLNNKDKAQQEFTLALKASPDHLAAKAALASMSK